MKFYFQKTWKMWALGPCVDFDMFNIGTYKIDFSFDIGPFTFGITFK